MSALPIVRFRLQTSDGSRWWRADCDWTQPAPNLLRLSVDANRAASKIRNGERGWRYAVEQLVAHGAPEPRGDLHAWLREVVPVLTRPLRHHGNHRYAFPLSRAARRSLPASASLPYPKLGIRPANDSARSEVA